MMTERKEMYTWSEIIVIGMAGIVVLFSILFFKGVICHQYGMDYSFIAGQCVVRGK